MAEVKLNRRNALTLFLGSTFLVGAFATVRPVYNYLRPRFIANDPFNFTSPEEIILDFSSASSARLTYLYACSYPAYLARGGLGIEILKSEVNSVLIGIEASKEREKRDRRPSKDTSYPDHFIVNQHRLVALPGAMASHAQNTVGSHLTDEIDVIHSTISETINNPRPQVKEILFQNLSASMTQHLPYAGGKLDRLRNQIVFSQSYKDQIWETAKSLHKLDDARFYDFHFANYILNANSIAKYIDFTEGDLFTSQIIDRLYRFDDPLLNYFIDTHRNVFGLKRGRKGLTSPQTYELLLGNNPTLTPKPDPEYLFSIALLSCSYAFRNLGLVDEMQRDVMLEKFAGFYQDFSIYENIIADGNIRFSKIVNNLPSDLRQFIVDDMKSLVGDRVSRYRSDERDVELLKSAPFVSQTGYNRFQGLDENVRRQIFGAEQSKDFDFGGFLTGIGVMVGSLATEAILGRRMDKMSDEIADLRDQVQELSKLVTDPGYRSNVREQVEEKIEGLGDIADDQHKI